jgi:hypothetical protein
MFSPLSSQKWDENIMITTYLKKVKVNIYVIGYIPVVISPSIEGIISITLMSFLLLMLWQKK